MIGRTPKDLKRALRRQKRLSRLKFLLVGGVFLAVILILWSFYYFRPRADVLQENKAQETSQDSLETEKHILHPHFEGVDGQGQSYHVKANLATQVSDEQIDLAKPEGELDLKNGEKVNIRALKGALTDKNKYLDLKGDVQLDYGKCKVMTQEAQANLETRTVEGGEVYSRCPEGIIKAQKFEVDQKKGIVTYKGRPHLIVMYHSHKTNK